MTLGCQCLGLLYRKACLCGGASPRTAARGLPVAGGHAVRQARHGPGLHPPIRPPRPTCAPHGMPRLCHPVDRVMQMKCSRRSCLEHRGKMTQAFLGCGGFSGRPVGNRSRENPWNSCSQHGLQGPDGHPACPHCRRSQRLYRVLQAGVGSQPEKGSLAASVGATLPRQGSLFSFASGLAVEVQGGSRG